ncbi:MAG: Flp pilus assembly complex ATPase component TadA [Sphingobium sp.]|nr:Flp pilus assembly complex ATPase component TadA [Sphingobium sp.]
MFGAGKIGSSWHKNAEPVVQDAETAVSRDSVGFEAMFVSRKLLTDEALQRAKLAHAETGESLEAVVTRLGLISEDRLASEAADYAGLLTILAPDFPSLAIEGADLSIEFLRENRAVPVAVDENCVRVAVADPFNPFIEEALGFMFGRAVARVVGRSSDIDAAIERLYQARDEAREDVDSAVDGDDLERLKDQVSDAPVIRAVNRLIARASDERASDIHIEPTDDALAVRFRIDGILRNAAMLPAAMRESLVSRIKVISGLNIAERRLPQDGRLRIPVRGNEIDLRVATSPSIHGESVVMRILDRSKLALDFGALGFDADLAAKIRDAIGRPHGIVLVTGPTGSGKTTTLYAALSELNTAERKLLTVEDPIEYRLPGVIQTQVNPAIGFTFSTALRSFLRQDPDVMMVGEIRDTETAQIAVQAALTGHMILSTLHTNTAAGAVSRLLNMGAEPFLLGSVLTGVLAQRLVRRLCLACRAPYEPSDAPAGIRAILDQQREPHLYRAVGCGHCGGSGYTGRIALHEFLRVDDHISHLILNRADTPDIQAAGEAAGMHSLFADGVVKAAAGLTTLEEIMRVATGED